MVGELNMKYMRAATLGLALTLGLYATACNGSARHIATKTDQAFATVVFAADDAWAAQCKTAVKAPTPAWCGEADPLLKKALTDVGIATASIQAMPKGATTMPTGLLDLVKDLSDVQAVIAPFRGVDGTVGAFAGKLDKALSTAVSFMSAFVGGK